MADQNKQQVRVCLSTAAIEKASDVSSITGLNLSEAVEACINQGHLPLMRAYGAIDYDEVNKRRD